MTTTNDQPTLTAKTCCNVMVVLTLIIWLHGTSGLHADSPPTITSSFDSNLEGWTTDNSGALTHVPNGGNTGGFLSLDNDEQQIAHLFAPNQFLGDLTAFDGGRICFDGNLLGNGGSFYEDSDDYGVIEIVGTAGTVSLDLVPDGGTAPLGSWHTYSARLNNPMWGVSEEFWLSVLSDVVSIRLTVEALFGPEVEGIDNFRIIADSEHPAGVQPGETYHIVFASSSVYGISGSGAFPPANGQINSLMGADWQMTFTAFISGLLSEEQEAEFINSNALAIIYMAILSDSTADASDRLQISGAIYNTNGDKIADDPDDLWDGSLDNPIAYDEAGNLVTSSFEVWTGSNILGEFSGLSCGDFNDSGILGTVGAASLQNSGWLNLADINCENSARLYGFSPPIVATFAVGDINGDCVINLLDVEPFIDLLSSGEYQFEADIDGNGVVNLLDVEPFILLLSGG